MTDHLPDGAAAWVRRNDPDHDPRTGYVCVFDLAPADDPEEPDPAVPPDGPLLRDHFAQRLLPASLAATAGDVLGLIVEHGWYDTADTMVDLPPDCPVVEAALRHDDGRQTIRVIDAVRAFDLARYLPPRLAWVLRHPSWRNR